MASRTLSLPKWHIPGSSETLVFGADMLHVILEQITDDLNVLVAAARQFAEEA